jgi:hypothetical protein
MSKKHKSSDASASKKGLDYKAIAITAGLAGVAAIVGGGAGAAIGRPSLAVGVASIGFGAYALHSGNKDLEQFGIPIMVMGGAMAISHAKATTPASTVAGLAGTIDEAKGRTKDYFKSLFHKTYIPQEYATKMGLSGDLGETIYFPGTTTPEVNEAQLSQALAALQAQAAYQPNSSVMSGLFDEKTKTVALF